MYKETLPWYRAWPIAFLNIFRTIFDLLIRIFLPTNPVITVFVPASGHPGTLIVLSGKRFSEKREDNEVLIGGSLAQVVKASQTELKVITNNATVTGAVKVKVNNKMAVGNQDFIVLPYPAPDKDGPPIYYSGQGNGQPGDVPSTGNLNILVILVNPSDRVPANAANTRNAVDTAWDNVETFYEQASYNRLDVTIDMTANFHTLSGDFYTYVDTSPAVQNVRVGVFDRLLAEACQAAVDANFTLNNYGIIAVVINLNGTFIRAWGGITKADLKYKDTSNNLDINITFNNEKNFLIIQESADWGRCVHEVGHNIVANPPNLNAWSKAEVLDEDVYASDLIDPSEATAHQFEMMGHHDSRPLFSGYHMEKLGYYDGTNIKNLTWSRNVKAPEEFDVVAHGMTEDSLADRYHLIKIKVTEGLFYYIEVRQRPGLTAQLFDASIPLNGAPQEGGVVVTRVLAGEVNMNQQTRFITLLHDPQVLKMDEYVVDPARDIKIIVVDDAVVNRPLVCRVSVQWGQNITNDPNGKFDLNITPWDNNYQTPDIWVDRIPYGSFDKTNDSEGRPKGNGDKPRPREINHFYTRIHNNGEEKADDVLVTFYSVEPPGVGDNGNWGPIKTQKISSIPKDSFKDIFVNWVPGVGRHTCLKVFISQQLGEISGGNNSAQENVFEFEAAASSIPDVVIMPVAVRNPHKHRTFVHIDVRGVPDGYTVHFPHSWLWLDPLQEKKFELTIVAIKDYTWYTDVYSKQLTANIVIEGRTPRIYGKPFAQNVYPASVMLTIGGITANVTPKKKVTITIEAAKPGNNIVTIHGHITPAMLGEVLRVDLYHPLGYLWAENVTTVANGEFTATINIAKEPYMDDLPSTPLPLPGDYKAQAHTINSQNAAEASSNIVFISVL